MGFYVLTNGDGKYIRKDNLTGKYVPIKSLKQATRWTNLIAANTILNNSIPKNIRMNYATEYISSEDTVEKRDTSVQNELCFKTIKNDNVDDWLSKMSIILDIFSDSTERSSELSSQLSSIDKEIVDIEHYIEFGKFNAYQGWICFKMLQNLLQQRRKYKNELQALKLIKDCKFDRESIKDLIQNISDIQNKCYTPRAFPELFKTIIKEDER